MREVWLSMENTVVALPERQMAHIHTCNSTANDNTWHRGGEKSNKTTLHIEQLNVLRSYVSLAYLEQMSVRILYDPAE